MRAPHWRAYTAEDNRYPREIRCFADVEQAVLYLANELAGRESDDIEGGPGAEGEELYWEMVEAYQVGFAELGDRFADLYHEDPAKWPDIGPAVLIVGFDYVIEGCVGDDCTIEEVAS